MNSKNPSFSSMILEKIYKEIDGEESHKKIMKPIKEKNVRITLDSIGGLGGTRVMRRSSSEEMSRACLMEKKVMNEKDLGRVSTMLPQIDHKLMQYNNGSYYSSDSSFGGFSSSETESSDGVRKTKGSKNSVAKKQQQSKFYLFDDYRSNRNHQINKVESKVGLCARKIYTKIKQPISPGGRLYCLINFIFSHSKKNRELCNQDIANVDHRKPKSTCSTVSSSPMSCLSKNSPNLMEKLDNRSVRFSPMSVIIDEPSGHKCINNYEEFETFHRTRQPKVHHRLPSLKNLNKRDDDFEDDGCASDSSSDLFELDHISTSLYNNNDRYNYDDPPRYETTHLAVIRAIANGFII